ncbi:MAG: ATP-binding protein [Deltaproteobacteria bacterium]|nr:ATP-binding protein [Deltaproteobacteria bacterium]
MERHILQNFVRWKEGSHRKPLIVRGARQVGKTYAISEFGRRYYSGVLSFDFEKNRSLRKIFEGDLTAGNLLVQLEIAANKKILPDTLLFFDEIQLCPPALMALRYFYEERPDLHLIAAGSLLEFEMEKISFPVGRVEFEWMAPLSFGEFLQATGNEALLEQRPDLDSTKKIPDFLHEKFLEQLRLYSLVGGMPEAVLRYGETKSLYEVARVHQNLIHAFSQDILKYERMIRIDSLSNLLEKIPRTVGGQVKYSHLMSVGEEESLYEIKKNLKVLEKSLLVHKVVSSSAQGLPLAFESQQKVFKYLFVDIGLMQSLCGIQAQDVLQSKDLLDIYEGALCEQLVGQELLSAGGSWQQKLYYWSRQKKSSNAEVDYLMVRNGKIYPLEVKKGPEGRLKSLHLFLEEHPRVPGAYVLNSGNVGTIGKIHFRPLYTSLKQIF